MKKQINPTIKAHLIRSAFYLLLLLAVCAIPFALAQSRSRGTSKRTVINPAANLNAPAKANPMQNAPPSSGAIGASSAQAQLPNAWRTDQSGSHNFKCCRCRTADFRSDQPADAGPTECCPL